MPFLGMGLRLPQLAALGGSAPPSGFIPNAVVFSGDVALQYATNSITASPRGVRAFWMLGNFNSAGANHATMFDGRGAANKYLTGAIDATTANAEVTPGNTLAVDGGQVTGGGLARLNFNDATASSGHSALASYGPPFFANCALTHVLELWDTNYNGAKRYNLLLNGVSVLTGLADVGSTWNGTATYPPYSAGDGYFINAYHAAYQATGDFWMAQYFFDTPSSSPLDASNNPTIDVTKFYNNGPVDYGATDGSIPLGRQPLIFHDGATATWHQNKGSLGNIATLVGPGSVAANKKLYDAPKSPGETADRPYLLWWADNQPGSHPLTAMTEASGSYSSFTNDGQPIAQGDKLIALISFTGTTANGRAPAITGWTKMSNSGLTPAGSGVFSDFVAYYKDIGAADPLITAAAAEWTSPTLTWTTKGASSMCVMFLNIRKDSGGPATLDDNQVGTTAAATAATGWVLPSVTAASAKSLLVYAFAPFDLTFEGTPAAPAGGRVRYKRRDTGFAGTSPFVVEEKVNATGATGTRTIAATVTGNVCAKLAFILS